ARLPRQRVLAWTGWLLASSPPSRAERLYVAVAAGLCIGLLFSYTVGRWMEGVEQEQSRALVAGGKDPKVGLSQGSANAPASGSALDAAARDASPAMLPSWVQTARGTKLWSAPSG